MDDEFDDWREWFDSHKEPDGSINLSKHPGLREWVRDFYVMSKRSWRDLPDNIGDTVNFELPED